MIEIPDFERAFEYENNFYLSCDSSRIGKLIAHYELYKKAQNLPGVIVECGVFKGVSLIRFAMFRHLLGGFHSKKIIGFDSFGLFPETHFTDDIPLRDKFIQTAGQESISCNQLISVLKYKNVLENIELVEGNILETVPDYVKKHPELKISLLNLDTDVYEPAVTVLEYLFPKLVRRGVLIVDDYSVFPGETKAVDDYFKTSNVTIQKYPFCSTPCFIIKD